MIKMDKPDILDLQRYLGKPGVVHRERQSILIPRVTKEYPDYDPGKCVCCGKVRPPRRWKYCSDECGKEYARETYPYYAYWWTEFRDAILKRDDNTCQECGFMQKDNPQLTSQGERWVSLDVHHILPLHAGGDEFDPENCITLCEIPCHKKKHRFRKLEGTGITQLTFEETDFIEKSTK